MKIYTKGGDRGISSLIGGTRVSKSDARLEAYGTLDELNSHIGSLYDILDTQQGAIKEELKWVILKIMNCSALLASDTEQTVSFPSITSSDIEYLEQLIDTHLASLSILSKFTLPLGHITVSQSNICRTVCRRSERRVVSLGELGISFSSVILIFINRLSDYFYALGRQLSFYHRVEESTW